MPVPQPPAGHPRARRVERFRRRRFPRRRRARRARASRGARGGARRSSRKLRRRGTTRSPKAIERAAWSPSRPRPPARGRRPPHRRRRDLERGAAPAAPSRERRERLSASAERRRRRRPRSARREVAHIDGMPSCAGGATPSHGARQLVAQRQRRVGRRRRAAGALSAIAGGAPGDVFRPQASSAASASPPPRIAAAPSASTSYARARARARLRTSRERGGLCVRGRVAAERGRRRRAQRRRSRQKKAVTCGAAAAAPSASSAPRGCRERRAASFCAGLWVRARGGGALPRARRAVTPPRAQAQRAPRAPTARSAHVTARSGAITRVARHQRRGGLRPMPAAARSARAPIRFDRRRRERTRALRRGDLRHGRNSQRDDPRRQRRQSGASRRSSGRRRSTGTRRR